MSSMNIPFNDNGSEMEPFGAPLVARLNLFFNYLGAGDGLDKTMLATREVIVLGFLAGRSMEEVDELAARALSRLGGGWRHPGEASWRWEPQAGLRSAHAQADVNFNDPYREFERLAGQREVLLATAAKADAVADELARATGAFAWRRVVFRPGHPWNPNADTVLIAAEFVAMAEALALKKEMEAGVPRARSRPLRNGL